MLGIDGGGSKTLLALAARDGTALRCWAGGGTNPFDEPTWRERLQGLAASAGPVAAVSAGLAGYGETPAVSAAMAEALAAVEAPRRSVHNDVQLAFDGAFGDAPGVLVLAGTGSMAWAQDRAGGQVRVGGWGHGIGDPGSAHAVGQRAVALVSEVLDGRSAETAFAAAILRSAGLPGPADPAAPAALVDWYYGHAHIRSAVAALARLVDARASTGCVPARSILAEAADALCRQVSAARRRLPGAGMGWSHAGGLFASPTLHRAMVSRLGLPTPPLLAPIGGALWRAARLAGWDAGPAWIARLAATLADLLPGPAR